MDQSDIKQLFDRLFNGQKNFMTPTVIKHGKRGKMVYELSTGEGISGNPIYGVTVIELPSTKRADLSKCFLSRAQAAFYISRDFT